ncbi:MAG: radical SAM protein [Thermodesulfobacteriota bacterium]
MKVLLINPPDDLRAVIGSGANLIMPIEPLGLLYVAAAAREAGHEVFVMDAFVEKLSQEDVVRRIAEIAPNVVGMTTFTSCGGIVYELGRAIRERMPEVPVVLGNVQAAVYAEAYLKNGACDLVVHGEGEYVFLKVLDTLQEGSRDFSSVPEVSFIKDGVFVKNQAEGRIEDLGRVPFPARDLVDQAHYDLPAVSNIPYEGSRDRRGKHMFTSRGCPNRCTFCTVHHSRRQRAVDAVRAVDEMEMLVNEYNAGYIFMMDSLFVARKKRVLEICDEIRRRNLSFAWGCEAHVRFVDAELIRAMDAAGCHDMAFGIESGVQRLLDAVKKNTTPAMVAEAVSCVRKNSDIKVSGLFILGLPGETKKDSLETIRFACSLPLHMAQFSVLVPYPGSDIYYELSQRGEIDTGVSPDGALRPEVWRRYSSYVSYTDNEPIWVTPTLSAAELKALQKKALRRFYFRPSRFIAQAKRLSLRNLPVMVKTAFDTFF